MTRYTRIIPPPVLTREAANSARLALLTSCAPRLQPMIYPVSELVNWEDEGGRLEAPGQIAPPADPY